MSEGNVSTRIESHPGGNVAHVTINREKKLNALSHDQAVRFIEAFDALHDVEDLRAVVLSGAGERAFMGGADVQELRHLDAESGRAFIEAVHGVCDSVRSCPVPVIGRINGFCLGAGMELAAACDVRIVSKRAVFGMPEVQVGLPSVVEAALLPMLIGWGKTRWLVLTGETITSEVANEWGFVESLVDDDELDATVAKTVASIVQAAPLAVRAQKRLTRRWETHNIDDAIQLGIDTFENACRTDEPRRYVDAMLERHRQNK